MVASLNGIIFDQIYGDNTSGAEFDTDADGTATQEDEFVSIANSTGAPIDISGWQIWSDSSMFSDVDDAQDGLFHTFPPGTVLQPGETLYIINEISGPTPFWAHEASEGGAESPIGGTSTNFLSEGGNDAESVALVNPSSGDFIVFNMDNNPSSFSDFDGGGSSSNPALASFPGSNMIAEIDGHSVQPDQAAGSSFQYNSGTDSYEYSTVYVSCFTEGTLISTPGGQVVVEQLAVGDLVLTADNGPQPIRFKVQHEMPLMDSDDLSCHPILFREGSLGANIPNRQLALSPQHRVVVRLDNGREVLVPAKAFIDLPGVRVKRGARHVRYVHLLLPNHEVIFANGAPTESLFLGDYGLSRMHPRLRIAVDSARPIGTSQMPARPFCGVANATKEFGQRYSKTLSKPATP